MSALLPQQMLICIADHDQFVAASTAAAQICRQILFRDQKLRRHEFDAIGEFAFRQPPVQARGDDAEIGCCQFNLQIFRPVARQQSDAIAANKATGHQYASQAVDAIQQLAIADQAVLIVDRRQGFLNPGAGVKQLADARGCARHFRRRFKRLKSNRLTWHRYPRKTVLAFCDCWLSA